MFHIAGRYNLLIDSKPLGLIEKRRSICKHDIHLNERVFFSKEWKKQWGCNSHCSKVWLKLERNGYEFLRLPIFIQSDFESYIALRDTDKSLEGTAKDLVYLQKDGLDESNETEIAIPDIYDNLTHNSKQIKEILIVLTNELAATREMNVH